MILYIAIVISIIIGLVGLYLSHSAGKEIDELRDLITRLNTSNVDYHILTQKSIDKLTKIVYNNDITIFEMEPTSPRREARINAINREREDVSSRNPR